MVRHGDFEVHLIDAETKQKLKEHTKGNLVYVEVEPDLEYFISIQKVGTNQSGYTYIKPYVDEKFLGYHGNYSQNQTDDSPHTWGVFQVENGMYYNKALKFNKPSLRSRDASGSKLLMGQVELKIFQGIPAGSKNYSAEYSYRTNVSTAELGPQHASLASKKSLRSGEGTATTKVSNYAGQRAAYRKGALIDTIKLSYCAALGLVEAGVLPKPGVWEHHRMKRPFNNSVSEAAKKARGSRTENDAIEFDDA